jgi:signal peptidase I
MITAAVLILIVSAVAEYWWRHFRGKTEKQVASPRRRFVSALVAVCVAAGAAVAFGHAFRAARVVSTSMVPTILPADRLWVNKLAGAPRRGDVIVFHRGSEGDLVKRVIGLPGDKISMVDSRAVVNGQELESCDAGTYTWLAADKSSRGHLVVEWSDGRAWLAVHQPGPQHMEQYTVQPGELFVLGDNRGVSNDSRTFGAVPLADVDGRVEHVLFGAGRDGAFDRGSLWRRLGTELHLTGVDLAPLQAGVERCLNAKTR